MFRLPQLPQLPGFLRPKKLDIIQRLKMRQFIAIGAVVTVVAFFAVAIATNMFKGGQKTEAKEMEDNETISQLDTTDYSNTDIVIPDGHTAYIDGQHTFKSVTVKSGGILTSHDYNRYGVYNFDYSKNATNLLKYNDSRYVFIMRGLINTGNDHTRTYSVSSGAPKDNTVSNTTPSTMNPDDAVTVNFYSPVSIADGNQYDATNWNSSNFIASYYGNVWNNAYSDPWQDAGMSSDATPLIPFEIRYYNGADNGHFGLVSCKTMSVSCQTKGSQGTTDLVNFKYFDSISQSKGFTPSSANVEMKTFKAWQSSHQEIIDLLQSTNTSNGQQYFATKDNMNSALNGYMVADGWNTERFYEANFDFSSDERVDMGYSDATTPFYDDIANQNEYSLINSKRPRSFFWPLNWKVTPLASRYQDSPTGTNEEIAGDLYPIMSRNLLETMPKKVPTVIQMPSGVFTVEGGGRVNFNGKGYAPGHGKKGGAGPGGGKQGNYWYADYMTGSDFYKSVGASHAGVGGDPSGTPALVYDNSQQVEPIQPGSGGYYQKEFPGPSTTELFMDYGGGYIKIIAQKVLLASNSMIMANGVGYHRNGLPSGGSGGTIVIIDNSPDSQYDGIISAMGAECSNNKGADCFTGGGGGGYIWINTSNSLQSQSLQSRYSSEQTKYAWRFYDGNLALNPNVVDYTNLGFLANTVTAQGGRNETGSNWGKYGIVKISTNQISTLSIKKSLSPVNRPSDADPANASFNPYALREGDKIRVTLTVRDVKSGTEIKDEVLSQPGGSYFCDPTVTGLGIDPADGVKTPGIDGTVTWTAAADHDGDFDYSYECIVKKYIC